MEKLQSRLLLESAVIYALIAAIIMYICLSSLKHVVVELNLCLQF